MMLELYNNQDPEMASREYTRFVKGVLAHKDSDRRIALFAEFLGIFPCEEGDFEFYLKGLRYCKNAAATTFARKYFHGKLMPDAWGEFDNELRTLGAESVDSTMMVMERALREFRRAVARTQAQVGDVFAACNVTFNWLQCVV